ncbi:MAG: hypothetical protein AVDCRST_MAG38-253 [uncultured Solirubrobacteraceae bacterium]|uniref:Uncharacterized protein n=1 Tax=uncultured Solirubrobacteraceae bacterium TaxID=1162706 RepID=A0A6J4R904_9ACTN|nr:MAG: hypothetical protein AVDCRST_MAG38-253 [uncultured Solirubrobacteraceae bacterium]
MRSRLAAWLVTGPVGHGYAGCADAAGLLLAAVRRRTRARLGERPRARRRASASRRPTAPQDRTNRPSGG